MPSSSAPANQAAWLPAARARLIGGGSASPCLDVVSACGGRKFVSAASGASPDELVHAKGLRVISLLLRVVTLGPAPWVKFRIRGVRTKFIYGSTLKDNEVGRIIYEECLLQAPAERKYQTAPDAQVVGAGLHHVQTAFGVQRAGMSAGKAVVSL
jgi:hypothetical protein